MNRQSGSPSRKDEPQLAEQPMPVTHARLAQGSRAARIASAMTMLAGFWLTVSPLTLNYAATGGGFNGWWNSVTVGGVLVVLALIRTVDLDATPLLSIACAALGVWLIVAPVVLGYNEGVDAPISVANHMAVGFIVMATAGFSAAATYRYWRVVRRWTEPAS